MSNGNQVFAPSQVRPMIDPGPRDFYVYSPPVFASIGPAVTQNQAFQIEADSNFYATALTYMVDLAGAAQTEETQPVPLITILITDSGSGRQLMNRAIPMPGLFGRGKLPYRFAHPRLMQRTTSIAVQLTNYSAATTYTNVYVMVHGFKVYGVNR